MHFCQDETFGLDMQSQSLRDSPRLSSAANLDDDNVPPEEALVGLGLPLLLEFLHIQTHVDPRKW
jgi:hypothetical protein